VKKKKELEIRFVQIDTPEDQQEKIISEIFDCLFQETELTQLNGNNSNKKINQVSDDDLA